MLVKAHRIKKQARKSKKKGSHTSIIIHLSTIQTCQSNQPSTSNRFIVSSPTRLHHCLLCTTVLTLVNELFIHRIFGFLILYIYIFVYMLYLEVWEKLLLPIWIISGQLYNCIRWGPLRIISIQFKEPLSLDRLYMKHVIPFYVQCYIEVFYTWTIWYCFHGGYIK